MLSYNIILVPYGILTDCWLNLNRLHTCAPIEKLKEAKGVPHVRAPSPPRRVMRAWRVVHERELVLPLGLATKEEGVQTLMWRSYYGLVTVHYGAWSLWHYLPSHLPVASRVIPFLSLVELYPSTSHLILCVHGALGEQASGTSVCIRTSARVCAGDQIFGKRLRDCSPSFIITNFIFLN
jgi:hypothetical protein